MRESSIQIVHENLLRMYGFVSNIEYDPMHDANIVRYYMIMERLVGVNLDQVLKGVTTDRSGMQIPLAAQIYESTPRIGMPQSSGSCGVSCRASWRCTTTGISTAT